MSWLKKCQNLIEASEEPQKRVIIFIVYKAPDNFEQTFLVLIDIVSYCSKIQCIVDMPFRFLSSLLSS
jgi:hypothetical protein